MEDFDAPILTEAQMNDIDPAFAERMQAAARETEANGVRMTVSEAIAWLDTL